MFPLGTLSLGCLCHSSRSSFHHMAFFPSLKQNFIAYRSSWRPDCIFEIHQRWQSGFSMMYSTCCCSCSFEAEILKIGPSSHNVYSDNILSTTILNAHTKKSLETYWRHHVYGSNGCHTPAGGSGDELLLSDKILPSHAQIKSLWGGFALSGLLGSGRASMLPLGTLSLGLWVIAVDPAFIAGHQSIKNCGIWIDQLDHLPAVMTTSFFLIFSEHPWDKLRTNLPHLQFLVNNCVYSSHTDIKLCTYSLYRHTTVLIHEILYLAH